MNRLLFIQEGLDEITASTVSVNTMGEVKMNILGMAVKGGWTMIPIVVLLFIAVGVFIERILVINKAAKRDDVFMERLKDYILEGNIKSAEKLCRQVNTPYARMIEKGVQCLEHPANDILVTMEKVADIEIAQLEKGFVWIATTAAIAPMLGFFGTVVGMVQAFFDMANAGSNVDITLLSSGIYTALVTTVAGLSVGIPVLFGYNYLVARIDVVTTVLETGAMDFMDLLTKSYKK